MPEEKKGHVKVTVDVEINEPMMEIVKEAIEKMPRKMPLGKKE